MHPAMIDGKLFVLAYPMIPPDACRHNAISKRPGAGKRVLKHVVKFSMAANIRSRPDNPWLKGMELQKC